MTSESFCNGFTTCMCIIVKTVFLMNFSSNIRILFVWVVMLQVLTLPLQVSATCNMLSQFIFMLYFLFLITFILYFIIYKSYTIMYVLLPMHAPPYATCTHTLPQNVARIFKCLFNCILCDVYIHSTRPRTYTPIHTSTFVIKK